MGLELFSPDDDVGRGDRDRAPRRRSTRPSSSRSARPLRRPARQRPGRSSRARSSASATSATTTSSTSPPRSQPSSSRLAELGADDRARRRGHRGARGVRAPSAGVTGAAGPRPRADRRRRASSSCASASTSTSTATPTSRRSSARYDAIVIRSATKLTAELIERADRLKVIGRAGVGVDNVDVDAATRRGIVVANAPESTVVSAAEHTSACCSRSSRNIPQAHAALKQGRWERSRWGGVELADKTLGVLGFGRIGQQVARRALGLGMRVVAYDPFVARRPLPRARRRARRDARTRCSRPADFLTLHLPLTDETRGFARRARRSRRCATARASSTPRAASSSTRRRSSRRSAPASSPAAALDVFSEEPYAGPAARARQRRRHAAPGRLDRGGAGPRRRDRRRAGRRRARGRPRHERRQHPRRRRRGPRGARPVHPARGEARPPRDGARRRAAPSGSRSPYYGALSELRHAAADRGRAERRASRAASTSRSTTSTRR